MNVYNYWHVFLALILSAVCYETLANDAAQEARVRNFFAKNGGSSDSSHTNNWAVLVCASRYWFNYRVRNHPRRIIICLNPFQHMANALGMYVIFKP